MERKRKEQRPQQSLHTHEGKNRKQEKDNKIFERKEKPHKDGQRRHIILVIWKEAKHVWMKVIHKNNRM